MCKWIWQCTSHLSQHADVETAPGQSAVYEPLITPLEAGNPNQAAAVDADKRKKKAVVSNNHRRHFQVR